MSKFRSTLLAAVLSTVAGAASAQQDPIVLKYTTFVPSNHVMVTEGGNLFMNEVTRLTNGRVKFEFYPAEQIGKAKQFIDLMNTGLVDIADIGIGYFTADRLPLLGIIEMPGLTNSSCAASRALRSIGTPGGILHENDFKANGIRALDFRVNPGFNIVSLRVPVNSIADLKGKKLRTAGGVMEVAIKSLGGIPVSMTSSEIYTALDRGTLDGVMFTYTLSDTLGFDKVSKYGTTGFGFGTPGQFIMISEATFQKMPKDIQDALLQAGKTEEEHICAYFDQGETKMVEKFKANGTKIHEWTAAEKAALADAVKDLPDQWIKAMEARGKPAKAALEAYIGALKAKY